MGNLANSVLIALFTVVTGLLFAGVMSRLLGMNFALWRRLAAGLIAVALFDPILNGMRTTILAAGGVAQLFLTLLGIAAAVLGAMICLVLAEVLVPTGSLPHPVDLVRGLRGRLARARRYSRITRIAVRHGLGPYLTGRRRDDLALPNGRSRLASSLATALDEAGVTFVKLGQILSTRRDLLPPEFVDELSRLRDRVAPVPWPEVERVLAEELDGPASARWCSATWTSWRGWPPRCTPGPAGAARSAYAIWRPVSPTRCGRSSTSGSRWRTWWRSRPAATPPCAIPSRMSRCRASACWSWSGWTAWR